MMPAGSSSTPRAVGKTFENRNPANTDDLIGLFQKSTRRDVEAAIDAAARAYTAWRLVPAPKRAEMLFRAAQLLVEVGLRPVQAAARRADGK